MWKSNPCVSRIGIVVLSAGLLFAGFAIPAFAAEETSHTQSQSAQTAPPAETKTSADAKTPVL